MKGVKWFWMKGMLAAHYIGPFPILEKCGTMAYKLDPHPSWSAQHLPLVTIEELLEGTCG
jgi:hypothetical protein